MKSKYYTVGKFPKSTRKIVEIVKIETIYTNIF